MEIFLQILWWVWNIYSAFVFIEAAAVSLYLTGVRIEYTMGLLLLTSTMVLLINYGILSGMVWVLKKASDRVVKMMKEILPQKKNKKIRRSLQKLLKWLGRFERRVGEKVIKTVKKHPYGTLFLLNLVPYAPYLSIAAIIAAKIGKIRYGIFPILAGNGVKVIMIVMGVYKFGDLLKGWF